MHFVPGTYFQYVSVPGKNGYNFGFSRGTADHHISRHEQANDFSFKTKVPTSNAYQY
jgi:hypothetical protein